jgi:alanyl-tRNA synthetase
MAPSVCYIVSRMSTTKLYWDDPFATTFEAEPARRASFAGKPSIVLSRTLFYPEAGGQLADTGTLEIGGRTLAVTDVQIEDDGTIHHLVDGLADDAALEGAVKGTIDRDRRRDHMAQHTAQHMLSRALVDVARAETVSARLGATACTIDVDARPGVGGIQERDIARAEDLVNAVVTDDAPVEALFPSEAELAALPLRRAPKVATNIRVIRIGDFDWSPCGGTHCTRTGQIGVVRVAGVEKYKGGLRVTFHAARRAIEDARKKEKVLEALAKDFTCGVLDVGSAVAKLRADLKARLDALSAARGELVELVSREALRAHPEDASGTTRVVLLRDDDDVATLRALAGRLASRPDVVAVCAARDRETGDLSIVVQRGANAKLDCGAWLKELAAKHGGRGGGRPERAEGRLPRGVEVGDLSG